MTNAFSTHPIRPCQLAGLLLALLWSLCASAQPAAEPLVLTALAPLHGLAQPLLANTPIELRQVPEQARPMQAQPTLFTRQAERFAEDFTQADAVIGISQVWRSDPFYITARSFNIRVVHIDAAIPWSHERGGIPVANAPASGGVSPYLWLGLSNVLRLLDNIAWDLQQLYPEYAATIRANLNTQKAEWLQLKADYEQALLAIDDPAVYALAEEFVYLTRDLGLFVGGYFIKQDIDWTEQDLMRLSDTLRNNGIRVVLHKWEPSEAIQAAIRDTGAELVILDTLETSTDFKADFERNLALLLGALGGG